jgi:hypothetical protein
LPPGDERRCDCLWSITLAATLNNPMIVVTWNAGIGKTPTFTARHSPAKSGSAREMSNSARLVRMKKNRDTTPRIVHN